jgi:hypothetical protein
MDAMTGRSIDVGIVTNNTDAMMAFYVDLLSLELVQTSPVPGGEMRMLRWGASTVKMVQLNRRTDISATARRPSRRKRPSLSDHPAG